MAQRYDLVVIGGGPGGYVAAIRGAQLGMRVALIEKEKLGGVCLNIGCIPTKALLRNAELLHLLKHASEFGISFDNLRVDFGAAIRRSRRIAERLSKGVEFLMKKNKIEVLNGEGRLLSPRKIGIFADGQAKGEVEAENLILATGSRPKLIPGLPIDGRRVLTSNEALLLEEAPQSITLIGAGAVGVEFADIYNAYGIEVTLIEMLPRVLPVEDTEISDLLAKAFVKKGIRIMTGALVQGVEVGADRVVLQLKKGEAVEELSTEAVLVAVGRVPNTEGIGLEEAGISLDRGSFIQVDEKLQTTVSNVYAIGDCIGPPLLAHKAMHEGVLVVEEIAGIGRGRLDHRRIPNCTYCEPQVASIGLTEEEAREQGFKIKVGRFPFQANGKALAMGSPEGLVKVIADSETGEILGVHIIGPEATELIALAGSAMTLEATPEAIAHVIHAHPTLSEAFAEANLAILGRAVHL